MISNPKGSNVKLGVTLEIYNVSQKARAIKKAETLVRPCAIKMNCKGHALHVRYSTYHSYMYMYMYMYTQV